MANEPDVCFENLSPQEQTFLVNAVAAFEAWASGRHLV
jgi:hypothetical protein